MSKISVLISARPNSKYLAKFMHGLLCRTGDFTNIEVLIMLNKNDTWNDELKAFYMALGLNLKGSIQFFEEDYGLGRDGLHIYLNDLAEHATGDWLIYFCEDHFIIENNWDVKIREFVKQRELDPAKINLIIPKFDNAGAMNHIVSRGLYTALGHLGMNGWIDSYINDIWHNVEHDLNKEFTIKAMDRLHRMDDELFHDFTHDKPEPMSPEHLAGFSNKEKIEALPKKGDTNYQLAVNVDAEVIKGFIERGLL